ncbi:MAG: UDP-glucose 4-epimerase [Candidatus Woesebacteria bacterium GW2011_GWF1_40_24]|uniref:UDP-glucose 4-epimerase n=3 Tax=Candidatus Woeseibacteriota TaxID=1752722 RepID=A0A0G0S130_9BACT|nr:MAG: UDP-glucose 4-epimerase [Candidatus Woesebacteria bacterium GW2011_GWB1_40_12]KKR55941.1 MAG: UDP-glucose 4-epimerase [Candidatus Woesebacteria bacterium GW2011_GWF1_40_24]KKS04102.1 MAG: UDP-glucose 4-epimerase [Candidatus Woesebacteria bacterium GW2011_GWE1_41_24]
MAKILVTGGAGYIGSFMVRELQKKGFEPVILDNLSQGHEEAVKDFRLEKIDLVTDKEKLDALFTSEKFDGVIHMASLIQMGESYKDPAKYYMNNVYGFLNLLDSMRKGSVGKIIISSSAGVYGNPTRLPIEEDDPKNPLNPYGETKYMLERILEDYDAAYGTKFISIRYFNAAGASLDGSIGEDHIDESHLIPNIIKKALKGEEIEIFGDSYNTPDGTNIRDYVHVLDLVEAHSTAMQKLLDGEQSDIYNAGSGKGYSNKEILETVKTAIGADLKIKYGERRPGDADALYASIEKIKTGLSWTPKYGLKEIVETALAWHKSHPQGYGR